MPPEMKKTILSVTILLLILPSAGCAPVRRPLPERPEISWEAFCAARGHNATDRSEDTVNEYLDTWRGSAEEDSVLIQNNTEPF